MITHEWSYLINAKIFVVFVLPIIVFFYYRNNRITIQWDEVKIDNITYQKNNCKFVFSENYIPLADRFIFTPRNSKENLLTINAGRWKSKTITLDMFTSHIHQLQQDLQNN